MAIILLIRHGENDWVGKRLAGRLPGVHLNQVGINQALQLAEILKECPIHSIYSSPLERAQETAKPLAEFLNKSITICENLSEINFGDWQGKTIKQLRRLKLWETVQKHPSQMHFPNGESFIAAQSRLVECINQIAEQHQAHDIVACFSHSDAIRLLITYYLDMPLDSFQKVHIHTTSISTLMILNDHISVPFVNLIDLKNFKTQFSKIDKTSRKKPTQIKNKEKA